MEYWPEVYQVIPTDLTKDNKFVEAATVMNGTVAWTMDGTYMDEETCLDLDAINLYETCPVVDEPGWLFKNYDG